MKSTVLYHYYGPIRKNRCCRQLNIKQLAIASAVYTLVSSHTYTCTHKTHISIRLNHLPNKHDFEQMFYVTRVGLLYSITLVQKKEKNFSFVEKHFLMSITFISIQFSCVSYSMLERQLKFYFLFLLFSYIQFANQQNISILVVLLYSWQISVNTKKYQALGEVYYGEDS